MSTGGEGGATSGRAGALPASGPASGPPRPPRTPSSRRRRIRRYKRIARNALGVLVAIAGLTVSVITIIQALKGDDDPPPPPTTTTAPPPTAASGTLSDITLDERDQTLAEYLDSQPESARPPGPFTSEQLSTPGNVFGIDIRVRGHRGRIVRLRWSLRFAGNGEIVPGQHPAPERESQYRPDHDDQRGRRFVWVPLPERQETYVVRFRLLDRRGELLDEQQTEPFRVV